jgi:histone acetyltransferase
VSFAVQGFTKAITLSRSTWQGFIKDYDGGTLMEFVIHPRICYSRLAQTVQQQRAELENRLRAISKSHVVHQALRKPGEPLQPLPWQDIPGALHALL